MRFGFCSVYREKWVLVYFFRNSDGGHIISAILYVPYHMYHIICITSYGPYDMGHIHWCSSLSLKITSDAAEWNTKYWAMDMGGYQHFNTTQCIEPTGGNYKARCCANTLSGSFSKLILSHNVGDNLNISVTNNEFAV